MYLILYRDGRVFQDDIFSPVYKNAIRIGEARVFMYEPGGSLFEEYKDGQWNVVDSVDTDDESDEDFELEDSDDDDLDDSDLEDDDE